MPSLLDPEALRRIENLELVAQQVVEGTLAGLHRSPFHGFSVEFLQHRAYTPGDNIRDVDWKVLAKTDRPYVKEHEDETTLRATILVDASGSMSYASAGVSKCHYAVRLAAALAFLFNRQQDAVGLLVFDEAMRKLILPASGRRQLKRVFDELAAVRPGGESGLGSVFHELIPRLPRRGLIFVLSDVFDEIAPLVNALAHFKKVHHEVVVFQIIDRDELEFPFTRWARFESLEDESEQFLVDPAQMRQNYLDAFQKHQDKLRQACHHHRVEFKTVLTDQPYDQVLAGYLANRGARKT